MTILDGLFFEIGRGLAPFAAVLAIFGVLIAACFLVECTKAFQRWLRRRGL